MAETDELYEADGAFQEEMYDGEEYETPLKADGVEGEPDQQAEDTSDEVEALKRKLREMEEEAAKLKQMQDQVHTETGVAGAGPPEPGSKEESDARSVYVGNVDYGCTPEELQLHFQECGTVNRVTILADKFGNPKGYAYIEFLEVDAVQNAVMLDNSELRGRQIKVVPKRTNVPGLKHRGRGRGRGYYPPPYYGRGYYPPPYARGYYGYAPRGRGRRGGYRPY